MRKDQLEEQLKKIHSAHHKLLDLHIKLSTERIQSSIGLVEDFHDIKIETQKLKRELEETKRNFQERLGQLKDALEADPTHLTNSITDRFWEECGLEKPTKIWSEYNPEAVDLIELASRNYKKLMFQARIVANKNSLDLLKAIFPEELKD